MNLKSCIEVLTQSPNMPLLVYANLPSLLAVLQTIANAARTIWACGQQQPSPDGGPFAAALHNQLHRTFGGWTSNHPLPGRLDHVYRLFPCTREGGQICLEAEVYRYDRAGRRMQAIHERQPLEALLARVARLDELTDAFRGPGFRGDEFCLEVVRLAADTTLARSYYHLGCPAREAFGAIAQCLSSPDAPAPSASHLCSLSASDVVRELDRLLFQAPEGHETPPQHGSGRVRRCPYYCSQILIVRDDAPRALLSLYSRGAEGGYRLDDCRHLLGPVDAHPPSPGQAVPACARCGRPDCPVHDPAVPSQGPEPPP